MSEEIARNNKGEVYILFYLTIWWGWAHAIMDRTPFRKSLFVFWIYGYTYISTITKFDVKSLDILHLHISWMGFDEWPLQDIVSQFDRQSIHYGTRSILADKSCCSIRNMVRILNAVTCSLGYWRANYLSDTYPRIQLSDFTHNLQINCFWSDHYLIKLTGMIEHEMFQQIQLD